MNSRLFETERDALIARLQLSKGGYVCGDVIKSPAGAYYFEVKNK